MKLPYTPKTVAQIPNEFQLLQDSQDIHACLESIGKLDELSETGCLFVSVGDGEYNAVFQCSRFTPLLNAPIYQLL